MRRIKEECDAAGVKVDFEKVSTDFQVTFYRTEAEITPKKAEKSEGVKSLIEYIRKNPGQRVPSISQATNIVPKTLERWLRNLKKEEKISFKGSPKAGGYYVK